MTVTSFAFGFGFTTILVNESTAQIPFKKVTGIGGIFLSAKILAKWKENNIKLWEPGDLVYDKFDGGRTK